MNCTAVRFCYYIMIKMNAIISTNIYRGIRCANGTSAIMYSTVIIKYNGIIVF